MLSVVQLPLVPNSKLLAVPLFPNSKFLFVMFCSKFQLLFAGLPLLSHHGSVCPLSVVTVVVVDVVCLQETHCVSQADCTLWFSSSGFLSCLSPGSNHSCGYVILYHPSLTLVDSWTDTGGRYLQCEFSLCDKSFRVCCLYAPNRNPDRGQFLDDVSDKVKPSVPTLLVGDFNTVFDRSKDRRGSNPLDDSRESSVHLAALFEACCVTDIWQCMHPDSSAFTWTRPDGSITSRIDLCGVPYVWVPSVSSCDIVPCPFSNHCALLVSLTIPDVVPPGPGLWK